MREEGPDGEGQAPEDEKAEEGPDGEGQAAEDEKAEEGRG